jgi:phosphatidate phosphatase APP1
MRFILFLVLACNGQMIQAQSLNLVSDYDDTVKIANSERASFDAILRAVLSNDFFPGMSELYAAWDRSYGPDGAELHFISASPRQLGGKIRRDLRENGDFPDFRLNLRDWFREPDTAAYKREVLSEYLNSPETPLILIGDDVQQDPEVYAELAAQRPVTATYIRHIKGRALLEGQHSFVTAFDVAAREFVEGRLDAQDALRIADVESAADADNLVPDFASCEGIEPSCQLLPLEGPLRWSCIESAVRVKEICYLRTVSTP